MPDQNGSNRLDRIEKLIEAVVSEHIRLVEDHLAFRADLRQLLTAQVLLTDRMSQLAEGQKHTDERLNALITVVDGLVRKQP